MSLRFSLRYTPGRTITTSGDFRLNGGNIVRRQTEDTDWSGFWSNWPLGYVKDNLDRAAGLGMDTIRVIGGISAVKSGAITQSVYVDRWEELVAECASRGMHVYACGGDPRHLSGASLAEIQAIIEAQATMLDGYDNVVGFDVIQERQSWVDVIGISEAALLSNCTTLAAAVRAITDIPLTFSDVATDATPLGAVDSSFDELVDFHDLHIYYTPTSSDADGWPSAKPLVFGEYGSNLTGGAALREARMAAVADLADAADVPLIASWTLVEGSSSSGFGLFDEDTNERLAGADEVESSSETRTR